VSLKGLISDLAKREQEVEGRHLGDIDNHADLHETLAVCRWHVKYSVVWGKRGEKVKVASAYLTEACQDLYLDFTSCVELFHVVVVVVDSGSHLRF
jgi:hypothetical protein